MIAQLDDQRLHLARIEAGIHQLYNLPGRLDPDTEARWPSTCGVGPPVALMSAAIRVSSAKDRAGNSRHSQVKS
jgi:hypothetical protein